MISDILSDAAAKIRDYLDTSGAYANMPERTSNLIYTALEKMDEARIDLDTPPAISTEAQPEILA